QVHWPPTHFSPGLQVRPQAPQANTLVCTSTQPRPLQQLWPDAQADPAPQRQVPSAHPSAPLPQGWSQPPQWAGSLAVSEQAPSQQTWLSAHKRPLQRTSLMGTSSERLSPKLVLRVMELPMRSVALMARATTRSGGAFSPAGGSRVNSKLGVNLKPSVLSC